ncbi:hypothetical protein PV569_33425 [Streptomyces scabiei]|uniref:hypothetical protein n=1 Tax=Streptomyces scabiei TaxID=1930 RepID=UPI0029B5DDF4|nr:hypothetical protein [Streptomyces scabiei]MDX3298564.1 hypothetical protein [Streptomyces scabiei]
MPHPRDPESVDPAEARAPAKAGSGVLVHSDRARALAAGAWLLVAAQDRAQAKAAWEKPNGIALLRCGGLFGAIRLSTDLVRAAAGTEDNRAIDAFLAEALHGAPVFMDQYAQWYYVLVPASTGMRPEWRSPRLPPGVEFLGQDCFLGAPRPDVVRPEEGVRSYWCVPMEGPGSLGVPDAVSQLVAIGRFQQAAGREADGSEENLPPSAG